MKVAALSLSLQVTPATFQLQLFTWTENNKTNESGVFNVSKMEVVEAVKVLCVWALDGEESRVLFSLWRGWSVQLLLLPEQTLRQFRGVQMSLAERPGG